MQLCRKNLQLYSLPEFLQSKFKHTYIYLYELNGEKCLLRIQLICVQFFTFNSNMFMIDITFWFEYSETVSIFKDTLMSAQIEDFS